MMARMETMAKRKSAAPPVVSKPRFFKRPVEEIPAVVVAPVRQESRSPDFSNTLLLSDPSAGFVRSVAVFDTRDEKGNGVFVTAEGEGDSKHFRIVLTVDGLRLFKTFDREQATKLCDNVDYEMKK